MIGMRRWIDISAVILASTCFGMIVAEEFTAFVITKNIFIGLMLVVFVWLSAVILD
jgi:hypothetical protein